MALSTVSILMVMATVVAVRGAIIPNMMFAPAMPVQQQQQQWRPAEAYGYMDRRPQAMMGDFYDVGVPAAVAQPVYGVPHRYISDPLPYSDPVDELYSNPLFRRMAGSKRSSASYYPRDAYDMMDDDDQMMADYDPISISQQDVANFEKYVQRYFQKQQNAPPSQQQDFDDWAADDSADDDENDEEAARQLHFLLNQQRRPLPVREIKKKNVGPVTTPTTTTSAPSTTTTTGAPTTATPSKHQHHQGQKEEAILRPPVPQHPSTGSPISPVTPAPQQVKEESEIRNTLQRLMALREKLQKEDENEQTSADKADEDEEALRMKRFVAPMQEESPLSKQLHLLDKIKA